MLQVTSTHYKTQLNSEKQIGTEIDNASAPIYIQLLILKYLPTYEPLTDSKG